MWTLVLIGMLLTDNGRPVITNIPGYSKKEYCEAAGKQYLESSRRYAFKSSSTNPFARDEIKYSLGWNYNCIEVK